MQERNDFNPYPKVSDQEAIEALKGWGINIQPSDGLEFREPLFEQPQVAEQPEITPKAQVVSQQPKRRAIDLGSKDVRLGGRWY